MATTDATKTVFTKAGTIEANGIKATSVTQDQCLTLVGRSMRPLPVRLFNKLTWTISATCRGLFWLPFTVTSFCLHKSLGLLGYQLTHTSNASNSSGACTKSTTPYKKLDADDDPWGVAASRYNTSISIRLYDVETSATWWVHTYHMPCIFTCPPLMTIHACLFLQHVQRLSGDAPYIICMDSNFTPGSPQYQLYPQVS